MHVSIHIKHDHFDYKWPPPMMPYNMHMHVCVAHPHTSHPHLPTSTVPRGPQNSISLEQTNIIKFCLKL